MYPEQLIALILVIFLMLPPVSVGLLLSHLSHGSIYVFLFLSQCVSERLGSQLQL